MSSGRLASVLEVVRAHDHDEGGLVRCAGCGLRGRWVGGVVVNAEGRDCPAWCEAPARLTSNAVKVGPRLRAHGPWLPAG